MEHGSSHFTVKMYIEIRITAQNLPLPTQPLCRAATKTQIQSASQLLALPLVEVDEKTM